MTRALLWLALLAPGTALGADVVRRAVVVGANDGGSLLERLEYAENDARKVATVLRDLGGFAADDVQVVLSPSPEALGAALAEVAALAAGDEQTLFLFYYSGHADALGLQFGGELVPYDSLKEAIRAIPADVHIGILDACRSAAITQVKGATVAAPFLAGEALPAEGEAWIAASSADEDAQESMLLEGSFFTYYLLSGLRGAADTGDGWVSLNEAYSYAYERTVARTAGTEGGTQHPYYDFQIQGNGDLKLTEVRAATARLVLPGDIAGEVAVLRLPENTPIAEVAKEEGRVVTLAIEPGRYLLRRRVAGGVQEVTVSVSEESELVVDRWGDTEAEVASRKGGTGGEYVTVRLPVKFDPEHLRVDLDLAWARSSPGISGLSSTLVPGAGQALQGRWGAGIGLLAATVSLHSIGWSDETRRSSLQGPNAWTFLALATHAWAVSDAAWSARRRVGFRPRKGITFGVESAWAGDGRPTVSGLVLDVHPVPGVSFGLDRTGVAVGPDDVTWSVGGRVAIGPDLDRWRPALVIAAGTRILHTRPTELAPAHTSTHLVMGGGPQVRLYLTPHYYVQADWRIEIGGDRFRAPVGLGLGWHVGR